MLDELYPTELVTVEERADFELMTNGRIDHFYQKYLLLTDIAGKSIKLCLKEISFRSLLPEIRLFQHQLQIKLTMHKEHLYEYLHFIRRNPCQLHQIEQIAQELINEESSKKQLILINKLIEIKDQLNFVGVFLLSSR